jgi:hypothetical protein
MNPLATLMLLLAWYPFGLDDCINSKIIEPVISSSSRTARITVLQHDQPRANIKLAVSLCAFGPLTVCPPTVDGNGKELSPAAAMEKNTHFLYTDSHGVVVLKDLPVGVVYITALGEHNYRSELVLKVASARNDEISSFVLSLHDPFPLAPAGIVQVAEENGGSDWLRQLSGTVHDQSDAVIRDARVEVHRRGSYSQGHPVAEVWADEAGRFRVPLDPGIYTVITRARGFKVDVRSIEITPQGRSDELEEILRVGNCPQVLVTSMDFN